MEFTVVKDQPEKKFYEFSCKVCRSTFKVKMTEQERAKIKGDVKDCPHCEGEEFTKFHPFSTRNPKNSLAAA